MHPRVFFPLPPSDTIPTLITGSWHLVSAQSCSYCGSLTNLQGYIRVCIFCCCSDINNVRLCQRWELVDHDSGQHYEQVFYFVKWKLNAVLIHSVKINIPLNLSPAAALDGKVFELWCCFDKRSPERLFLTDLFSRTPSSFTPCWVVAPSGGELPAIWHMPLQRTSCPHHGSACFRGLFSAKIPLLGTFENPLRSCDEQLLITPVTNDWLRNNTNVTCGLL